MPQGSYIFIYCLIIVNLLIQTDMLLQVSIFPLSRCIASSVEQQYYVYHRIIVSIKIGA